MDIVVIGGTSRTGVHVVEQAVARGHRVTLFCRDAAKVPPHLAAHRVVTGDARDAVALRSAVAGQDAVVCILAPDGTGPTRLVSDCVAALLPAMRDAGVARVVLCSARPVVATRPALVIGLLWLWLRNA
ncbi:MAG: NAD(P)H-binding protein, partial [Myxococcales bacterium]|nr:NAD(P)H-binding protein [Myxococcales bacterium]